MPVAESFSTRGAGNGLPNCTEKTDVSGYDYWTTLSGFNKAAGTSPTDAQIEASLQKAFSFFYNFYAIRVYGEAAQDFGTLYTSDLSPADSSDVSSDDNAEPSSRICSNPSVYVKNNSSPFSTSCKISGGAERIRRFYDGDTTDEANFVGYGMLGYLFDLYCTAGSSNYASEIRLYGVGNTTTGLYATDYTEIDGYHFVCRAKGFTTRDAVNASATSVYATAPLGYNTSASIDSLEFYTYA